MTFFWKLLTVLVSIGFLVQKRIQGAFTKKHIVQLPVIHFLDAKEYFFGIISSPAKLNSVFWVEYFSNSWRGGMSNIWPLIERSGHLSPSKKCNTTCLKGFYYPTHSAIISKWGNKVKTQKCIKLGGVLHTVLPFHKMHPMSMKKKSALFFFSCRNFISSCIQFSPKSIWNERT